MAARTSAAEPATTPSRARRTAKADEPQIIVRGAREHNLKNVNVELPRDKLIVFTGLSGSGKSSLAFDTIYAEGQRRYVESLSSYARQFLGQMDKPDVDVIEGLSPAISIDQKSASRNPRSTVGTITEVYDYLRLLYARIGIQHCPERRHQAVAPDPAADRRPHPRHGRRHPVPGARAGRAWAQGRVRHAARGPVRTGIRAGAHRRRDRRHRRVPEARRAAREVREPQDRDRRRPARVEGRHRAAPHRLARAGARARRRRGRDRGRAARGRGPSRRRSRSASTWRARSAARATTSRRRATSRSTRRTAPVRPATGWAPRSRSTRSCSSPIRTCRSPTVRSRRGEAPTRSTSHGCSSRSPRCTRST